MEGMKFKVTAQELATHMEQRAKYHILRATEKEKELPELRSVLGRIRGAEGKVDDVMTSLSAAGNAKAMSWLNETVGGSLVGYQMNIADILDRLGKDIKNHQEKAWRFRFLARHLDESNYILTENDLVFLEFFS